MKQLVTAAVMALTAAPALAEDDGAFVTFQSLKPEVALQMAQAAMEDCREKGTQIGVTVVDRFGMPQVFLRDRFAGPHVYETAFRKAWTAISFRGSTLELDEVSQPGQRPYGLRHLSQALPLGGGLPVLNGEGSIVAGIGVSGAPSPEIDDECAAAGIAAVEDQIAF